MLHWSTSLWRLSSLRVSLALVVGLTLGAYCWVLALPFAHDDVIQIPEAQAKLVDELRALPGGEGSLAPVALAQHRWRFRPVLWATFWLERTVQRAPLVAAPFYAVSLALHALTAALLLIGLRHLLPAGAALAGALWFGVHPAAAQATAWVAARGDILCGLFAVLSWLAILQSSKRSSFWCPLLAGVALAGAIGSKDTAYAWCPVLFALLLWHGRHRPRRLLGIAAFLAPVLLMMAWRHTYIGTWRITHTAGGSVEIESAVVLFRLLPDMLTHMLVPWMRVPEMPTMDPLLAQVCGEFARGARYLFVGVMVLGIVTAHFVAGFSVWRKRLVPGALCLVFLLAPIVFLFVPDLGQLIDRAFYQPKLIMATLVASTWALCASAAATKWRWTRWSCGVALVVAVLAGVDSLVQTARVELAVAERSVREVVSIEREARALPPGGIVVITQAERIWDGAHFFGDQMPWRLREPFLAETIPAVYFVTLQDVLSSNILRRERGPLLLLRGSQGGELAPVRAMFGPIPNALPRLVRVGPEASFRPAHPVPVRGVAAVKFFLPAGRKRELQLFIRVEGDEYVVAVPMNADGAASEEVVLLYGKPELLLAPELLAVGIGGLDTVDAELTVPVLLATAPEIAIVAPASGMHWRPGDMLAFEFVMPVKAQWVVAEFVIDLPWHASISMVYELSREQLRPSAGGAVSWVPLPEQYSGGYHPEVRLEMIPVHFNTFCRPVGIPELPLRWRISALTKKGGALVALSAWSRIFYL